MIHRNANDGKHGKSLTSNQRIAKWNIKIIIILHGKWSLKITTHNSSISAQASQTSHQEAVLLSSLDSGLVLWTIEWGSSDAVHLICKDAHCFCAYELIKLDRMAVLCLIFLRYLYTVFTSGCTILQSDQ